VPVDTSEWTSDPFKAEIRDDRLYGRGVLDDKGPAAICMYILKIIKEQKLHLNKRIRIIFGIDEESGWEDMDYYLEHEEIPSIGFTPDADFPIIAGEKGIIDLELTMALNNNDIISMSGGNALNSVPSKANAKVQLNDVVYDLESIGKAAHASTPEAGDNAILSLMGDIQNLYNTKNVKCTNDLVNFFSNKIKDDYNGKYLDFVLEDEESGKLTINIGKIDVSESIAKIGVDLRYPITYLESDVIEQFKDKLKPYVFSIDILHAMKPIYFGKDNDLIKHFLKIYQDSYDKSAKPIVIGGGTFARAMDNIVAFGPLFPNCEDTGHQKDEYMPIKDIMKASEIYAKAILYLIER
jgi:succinyl-diaminopimelate desuccinylase